MTIAVLNVKIDESVKEKLRHYAEANGLTLGAAAENLRFVTLGLRQACSSQLERG